MESMTIGEYKARHNEEHLCGECPVSRVCKIAAALDPSLIVTISRCSARDDILTQLEDAAGSSVQEEQVEDNG